MVRFQAWAWPLATIASCDSMQHFAIDVVCKLCWTGPCGLWVWGCGVSAQWVSDRSPVQHKPYGPPPACLTPPHVLFPSWPPAVAFPLSSTCLRLVPKLDATAARTFASLANGLCCKGVQVGAHTLHTSVGASLS